MKNNALRTRLLFLIATPLLGLLIVEAYVTYRISLGNSNQVFDSWLVDSAQSLSRQLELVDGRTRFVASRTTIELFKWDELDEVHYRITNGNGEWIAGSERLTNVGSMEDLTGGPVFLNQLYQGSQIRTVSVLISTDHGERVIITVGETLRKRNAMIGELLTEALVSKTLLLLAIFPAVWFAIGHGLRAISELNRELSQRSPNELTPISLENAPQEVDALSRSINELLFRIDRTMGNQEQFLGNIGHQMRTPLAGIKLQAQLAQREGVNERVRSALTRIADAADKMTGISNKLLKLAEAQTASGRGLQEEPIDLVDLAEDCVSGHAQQANSKSMELRLVSHGHPAWILGDRTLLMELLANLVDNAVRHGCRGGRVSVMVEAGPDQVRLAVEDDGPGIDSQYWSRVFERFTRLPSSGNSNSNSNGSGLGLAIVREIARAHGTEPLLELPETGRGIRITVGFAAHLPGSGTMGQSW